MSLYSLLLIGAWVLGSGVVAYICDNLGRKLGKKRLTMWGLRPRHTAMVITVLTGMGIAILTVCLVALVNVDARRALFSVGQLNQELLVLGKREQALNTFNRQLEARNKSAEDRAHTSEKNAQFAGQKEKAATTKAGFALVKLNVAERQRDQVERKLLSASVRLARLEVNRRQLTAQVHERQARLATLRKNLAGLTVRYKRALAQVSHSRSLLDQNNHELILTQDILSDTLQVLKDSRNEVTQTKDEKKRLSNQIDKDKIELKGVTDELNNVTAELKQGQEQLQALKDTLTQTALSAVVSRRTPYAFPVGEEIARRVIYRPDDEGEVRREIQKLMDAADENASSHGAKPDAEGLRSVKLVPINFPMGDQHLETWDEDKQISEAAKQIAQSHEDVVVRVMTGVNSLADEPVQAYLEVRPNRLIFPRSAVVARLMVDGSLSDAKLLETLIDLLQTKVRAEALRAGLLPPPSGSLGEINWEQLLGAVHELRERNALAEIQVITQADVWTADPLDVRFVLQT